ncbi:RHS repeat-associated core domain-containing protein [Rapidithrix thailandica]|uniref:RHS repeat-associated core domain-containing protein n=1 Tax=Rapidithrix thailandica TaxID=413964 RepID=A0AAW9RZU7_9BACT
MKGENCTECRFDTLSNVVIYFPRGKQVTDRKYSDEAYRCGFNGKENDKDFGNQHLIQDYGFRLYNPEIGKFLSVDPLTSSYPWYTPIAAVDLDGLEDQYYLSSKCIPCT